MKKKIYHKVSRSVPRIDQFLAQILPNVSRSYVEKLIESGKVSRNGVPVTKKNLSLLMGDRVEILIEKEEQPAYTPSRSLQKLFEDEWLIIIEKPAGISVHPGAGVREETILDIFRFYYPQINSMEEKERPGLVHRLDKDTSGILLLAKDELTMKQLQKQFKQRKVEKTYLALVNGTLALRHGVIDAPITRDLRNRIKFRALHRPEDEEEMRSAVTRYSVIREFSDFSLVRVMPETGRTHQIRVHFSSIGHPVCGDSLYGTRKDKKFFRLALHAYSLSFFHPKTKNRLTAVSPLPQNLRRYIARSIG